MFKLKKQNLQILKYDSKTEKFEKKYTMYTSSKTFTNAVLHLYREKCIAYMF